MHIFYSCFNFETYSINFQYDAEIVFLEGKEREKKRQLDFLTQEIISVTNLSKSNQEQVSC